MRPGTATRQFLRHTGPLTGAWEDVGAGSCFHCKDTRRLYKPLACPEIAVCCQCTQIFSNASLGLFDRNGEVMVDHEVPAKAKKAIEVVEDDFIEEESFSLESFSLVDGRLDVTRKRVSQRAASRRRLARKREHSSDTERFLSLRQRGRLH